MTRSLLACFRFLFLAALLFQSPARAQENGRDYLTLPTAMPAEAGNRVEVIEFFFYTCPFCNAIDPFVEEWRKAQGERVLFKRVPVDIHGAAPLQRMYYALEAMGLTEQTHTRIFQAIHKQHVPARTDADVAKLVASLGVDSARYEAVARSFAVQNRVARVAGMTSAYRVDGVPFFVVDGRWTTSPSQLVEARRDIPDQQLNSATMTVLDHLVEKARQQKGIK